MERLSLSARAYDRIVKVARSIADLDEKDDIGPVHVARALERGRPGRRCQVNPLSHRAVFRLLMLFVGTGWMLASAPSLQAQAPELPPELQKVRAALEKYQDPYVAVHDGYFSTLGCVEFPKPGPPGRLPYAAGGMGIHFLNPRLIGPVPDPMRPPILLYVPDGDKLRLVGAEWFIPLATGIKDRPQLFGQPFDGPMEGHEPLLPHDLHHYDLHVWLWRANPAGLFSPTNPNVKCGGYGYTLLEEAPPFVPHPKP